MADSNNSLSAFNPEFWAAEMQEIFFKENVAISLANAELRAVLKIGDRVNKPYRSHPQVTDYTSGKDITVFDVEGTNDYIEVTTAKLVPFYIDDIDRIQNKWDMASKYARDAMRLLNNVLDQVVLGQHSYASSDVYAADVGGSGATTNLVLTSSNISNVFTASSRKLDEYNISQRDRFAVLGTRAMEALRLSLSGRETGLGDKIGLNGLVGSRFGFDIYYSNNCPYSATFTPTALTATDTVSINGVTFTFSDTPDAAGEVDSSGTLAESLALLVHAINSTGTPGATTYVAISDDNRWKITQAGIVATENDTALAITGYGDIVVTDSESDASWSVQTNHLLFGAKDAIDLLVQKSPSVEFRVAEKRLGRYIYPWMLYGIKTFGDGADQLVDVNIDASSWA